MNTHRPDSMVRVVEKMGFVLLDKALGVCALNEALFRRSAVHKRHIRYNSSDIATIDVTLSHDIQIDARKYGFRV